MTVTKGNTDAAKKGFILPHGIEIDLNEAWRKLIAGQFLGNAGRGFGELIQNFLDSYPSTTPWKKRKGVIKSGKCWVSITDFGEGMGRDRLKLLVTLGGTDKNNNKSKIGTFGIGFFSIFNPKLGTKKVTVTTKCEEQTVELVFLIEKAGKRPLISTRILGRKISYSTRIKVEFDNQAAVNLCLDHAHTCLNYYPCQVTINGKAHESIWQEAERSGASMFQKGACDGFLKRGGYSNHITLLCKYEHLLELSLTGLITGGHYTKYDLRDYKSNSMAYLENTSCTVNCNDLSVTISRDSFSMNSAYNTMVRTLADVMLTELGRQISVNSSVDVVLANQYTVIGKIKSFVDSKEHGKSLDKYQTKALSLLVRGKVYRINGRRETFSLQDLLEMKSANLPLFYSPNQSNLRWLGGNFKHDFIVLPPRCNVGGGAPDFYEVIFKTLFKDIVNLDTIKNERGRLQELVESGIVDKENLSPKVQFQGERDLTSDERQLLEELDGFFSYPGIRKAITRNLHLPVKDIRTVFFDVKDQKAVIATGLFDGEGKALTDTVHCNLNPADEDGQPVKKHDDETILLGLHRDHDLIKSIIANKDPNHLYFSLPILAHELALCQKLLVPYSPCYHLVKERLAGDMRKALMEHLLPDPEQ